MTAALARTDRVRVAGQRQQTTATAHFRLMVMMLLFIFVTGIVGARLLWLAVASDGQQALKAPRGLVPDRGDIVDRNGMPLATTIDAWSIAVHPNKVIGDPALLAYRLAELMPQKSEAQYLAILTSPKKFAYLSRRAVPELVKAVNALGEPAIEFRREPERLYPQASLAAHVLGWIDQNGNAASGMEKVLDARLSDPTLRGRPVALSIDSRVQAAMETELGAAMAKHSAIGATGLVLDVNTGEIVAMSSLPSFNPNRTGNVPYELLLNKSVSNVYELGSTFKMLTMANAIESGVVTSMSKRYDATHALAVGGFHIRDDHPQNRWLNVPELLVHSSNIATARIADELGPARTQAFFRKVGFGDPVDIEVGGRAKPLWPKYWARTTTMTVAYGHGIAVTPLHLASAYAALVNGGVWRPATLLKREGAAVPAGRRVISPATSDRIRQLMRLVVMKGTGRKADAPGLRIGGKTGTAEKPNAGGYDRNTNVSTFAAVFPMDRPRYVVIAMLDSPKGTADTFGYTTAAWTVGPVISRVVQRIGPMLGIRPDDRADVDESELLPLLWEPKGANPNAVE
ncbi:peptidoglycan D,D-transpeptidase FtsI family protein [Sphingomonas prati]|uniref:Cell division protein FtsI (Penicillin-binding protein 3) n=1 Tax=Sphingomonas prati TaxID=1843237 RepID=A0A7W9F240_9SPHN|nr:penicillin-binding protein 2 [Sphingomonas prati]MBB5729916.1 cell division protein FtsI (penicillin-binding protein 3) [Sphingomonas prati]GGE88550.1 peptidoglycan glycosyltransferase [Sphingomonas prati]